MSIRRPDENRINAIFAFLRIRDSMSRRLIGKVKVMSNKLRSFLIVVISIAVVMAALPMNAFRVNADVVYFLTYDGNEGKDETGSSVHVQNSDDQGQFTISDNILPKIQDAPGFIREGYVFNGWADSEGTTYTVGDKYTPGGDLTIYAQWAKACVITFDPNYPDDAINPATDSMTDQVVGKGVSAVLNTIGYSCENYTFKGWTEDQEGEKTLINDGDSYTATDTDVTLYAQWEMKISGTVKYNPNLPDGITIDTQMSSQSFYAGEKFSLNNNEFVWPDHVFLGWKTSTGISYENGEEITLTASDLSESNDIELFAQWMEGWTISFNSNGAPDNGEMVSVNISSGSPDYSVPACPYARDGYTFRCWRADDPVNGDIHDSGTSFTVTQNTVLYAVWYRRVTLHIYDEISPVYVIDQDFDVGKPAGIVTSNSFTSKPEGKTFLGWATEANSKNLVYADGAIITMTGNKDNDLTDLYALWGSPVTIKFEPNSTGVSGSMDPITSGIGLTTELPKVGYSLTGHSFKEWEIVGNPEGVTISGDTSNGYSVSIADDYSGNSTITLKAIWSPIAYDVCFKNDDGTVLQNSPVAYGSTPSCAAPTKADTTEFSYSFDGWDDGSGTPVTALPTVTGPVTYTAVFTKSNRQYSVTASVSPSGAGTVEVGGSDRYSETAALTVNPTVGYHVVGWTNNGDDAETAATAYNFTVKGNHTVVVYLEKDPHTVNVSSSGGGEVVYNGPDDLVYGDVVKVVATPSEGYQFVRWVDLDDNEVSTDAVYEFTVTADYSYKAVFALKQHDISVSAGAHGSVTGGGTYKHFESCEVVATPDKGYHFAGWTEDGTIVSENPNYSFSVTGNRKLEAVFEINMYTVTYKNDDGTILQESELAFGSTASYQHMANPTKKPTAQFTYTFAGWDNTEKLVTKDITYTATYTYTVNKYKITFANEDGTVLQTGEIEYGKFPVYEKDTPTKAATVQETFTFAGWDKEISKVTGEAVYTATYTSKPITKDSINYKYFTVAFVTNGGSEIVSQLVAEGGVAFKPEEPLRERYTFGGWYIDEALTKPFSFATAITSDITLYAKWIKGSPDIEATYAVVGLGSTSFELGSGEDITVAVERSKDNDSIATHFKGVLIDGVEVDYYNYELAEDNSSVIIRADALEGLDAGAHTITIVYDDGTAEVELVVADANEPTAAVEKITETEAGDTEPVNVTTEKSSNWGLWIALGIVAVVVIAAIPIFIIKGRSLK